MGPHPADPGDGAAAGVHRRVPVAHAAAAWTAYNDSAGTVGGNTTAYTITSGSATGLLKNWDTGANTSVTVTFTWSGDPQIQTGTYGGAETASGTDAYTTFHGFADMPGVIQYGSTGWWVDVTFTGLDPAKTYTFATSANRAGSYTDRISRFTLSDATTATNASTAGVTKKTTTFTEDTSAFNTGENTANGYVARWTGIQPGSDGDFKVRAQADTTVNQAYAFSVFMLQEEQEITGPTITTSGTLTAFSSNPGVASAEQSYTVNGYNLTEGITVTAPADFEVSLTSGSGFGSSVSLGTTGGTVYVHYLPSSYGTSSGNITHTSSGATQVDKAVSGTASTCTTVSLSATEDTWLNGGAITFNYGGSTTIQVNGATGSTNDQGALLKWDLSGIPTYATVSSATSNARRNRCTGRTNSLYNMRRTWVEGSLNGTVGSSSSQGANWTY